MNRQLQDKDIRCQYGELTGDDGVRCQIEDVVIRARIDPSSLLCFCLGDPELCPTLRKEKDAGHGEKLADQVAAASEVRSERIKSKSQREERVEAARELLTSDSKAGEQFRARVAKILQRSEVQQRLRAAGARDTASGLVLPPGVRR